MEGFVNRRGSPGLSLAVAVVLGSVTSGVIGSKLEEEAVAQGRVLLVPAVRRLDTLAPLGVAWAVFGVLSMMQFDRRSRAHAEELREVARSLGLDFEEGQVKDSLGLHPGAPLFERWGSCENRLSGTIDGAPAAMFDLMTIEGTGEGERRRSWTVILFAQSRLPFFLCVPRRWTTGSERANLTPINFDSQGEDEWTREAVAAFETVYVLGLSDTASASGEDPIRRHFCAPRLEAMAQCPNWHIQSASGFLVFALSWTAPAEDRPALWHEALELRRALLAPLPPGTAPIPAAPGMDVGSQRARRDGRRAGCLAGAVLGGFGSFIAFSAFMFSRMGPGGARLRPPVLSLMPFLYFGSILGGLLIGTLAGRWIGGLIADLRYTPAPGGAAPPRISKGWVAAGAFLGCVLGAAVGMGLTMLVEPQVKALWLMPIFFFSPPVLGLVLGGFAGLGLARRRAARREGQ
jgi:hypothetical protein